MEPAASTRPPFNHTPWNGETYARITQAHRSEGFRSPVPASGAVHNVGVREMYAMPSYLHDRNVGHMYAMSCMGNGAKQVGPRAAYQALPISSDPTHETGLVPTSLKEVPSVSGIGQDPSGGTGWRHRVPGTQIGISMMPMPLSY